MIYDDGSIENIAQAADLFFLGLCLIFHSNSFSETFVLIMRTFRAFGRYEEWAAESISIKM